MPTVHDFLRELDSDVSFVVPRPTAASSDQLLTTLDESVAKAKVVIGSMDDAALATPWRMLNGNLEIALSATSRRLRRR